MATDKLTDKFCKTAPPGKHFDGGGLFLLVDDKLRRYWRQKYLRPTDRKADTLAHGVYPDVGLAEARVKRDAAKKLIKAKIDPKAKRRDDEAAAVRAEADAAAEGAAKQATLFSVVVESYFETKHRPWSATHRRDVQRIIDGELVPALGAIPMQDIKRADIQAMLKKIAERGALTYAKDVRLYFRAIHKYYNALREDAEKARIPDPSETCEIPDAPRERGHAALSPPEIGPFLRALDHSDAGAIVRIATRMLLLTAVRTTELRAATWGEFDTKAAVWRIPPERMKADRGHVVPLSKQALVLLVALRQHTGGKTYLFPNGRDDDRPMSENAILGAIKRMGYQGRLTGHGMRAMFSTWAHEATEGGRPLFRSDAIERQLAHAPSDKVKAAYLRSEFMDMRTRMMQAWADWLDGSAATADVIPLPRLAAHSTS